MSQFCITTGAPDLPLLLRVLAGVRVTGRLHIAQARWRGEICFADGRLVAAAFGAERGLPALQAILLALPDGRCIFHPGPAAATANLALGGARGRAGSASRAPGRVDRRRAQRAGRPPGPRGTPGTR